MPGLTHQPPAIQWPDGKRFAFTVFDDPDAQSLEDSRRVYGFLAENGFRTTKAVWPIGPLRERNSSGDTCESKPFLEHCVELQSLGFEMGFHNAAPHSCLREETLEGLRRFRESFGHDPESMANHYNDEAIYWGAARLTGASRQWYRAIALWRDQKYQGEEPNSPYFWGDLCRQRVRYCRNLVYREINTLKACPWMPYSDPHRPYVQQWYSSAEGADGPSYCQTISEEAQDRLEAEGGACVMYTHFGRGFREEGALRPDFKRLMKRLANKNGWFVPLTQLLDLIREQRGEHSITAAQRGWLERRWLAAKMLHGTS